MTIRNLEKAFLPRSIALIGATGRERSVGATVMRNLLECGFAGPVWLVNPKYTAIGGAMCYESVGDVPGTPDLGIVVTPPETVPGIIDELGAAGARAALVITAGISEASGLRQKMLEAAKPYLLRVIGPNSLGMFVPHLGLNASFAHVSPRPGPLAFLSQSGALAGAMLDWAAARQIGFSHVVSMGDMADVDMGDMLDYLAGDVHTGAILLYMEAITSPKKFLSAARSACRAKPVVAVKAGRHRAGAKAAMTHTGALAGADDVADAAMRRAGILRVHELEELFDAAETLTRLKPFLNDGLTIITNGGGAGVLAVDKLMDFGGTLTPLSEATRARLDEVLPSTWSRANPIDIIGDAGPERYAAALDGALNDDAIGAILVMNCPTALASSTEAAEAVLTGLKRRDEIGLPRKPVLANWLGSGAPEKARALFAENGVPSYESPDDAVRGFHYLTQYRKAQTSLMRTPPGLPRDFAVDRASAAAAMKRGLADGGLMLSDPETKLLLAAYGIPIVETRIAKSAAEAAELVPAMLAQTGAIVLKILSPDLSHKSDVGGVALNLRSADEVKRAAERMLARAAEVRPEARIEGFTLQTMISRPHAHELILGVAQDAVFGPVMIFGAGGTAVEVINDKCIGLPPLDLKLAGDMIEGTRVSKLLKGYRDREGADIEGMALALVRLSHLIADFPAIEELDINPLLADGKGVIAIDARIKLNPAWAHLKAPNPRFAIRPYPNQWEKMTATTGGRRLLMRPIQPTDEAAYKAFLDGVGAEDIRNRFFAPQKQFSHEFMARFTQIDYARAMAFVAADAQTGEILGVSRLSADPDYAQAEYAVLVLSSAKRQGIGSALMRHLIAYARSEGLQRLTGEVLAGNAAMLSMCRQLGFVAKAADDDPGIMQVTLDLKSAGVPDVALSDQALRPAETA